MFANNYFQKYKYIPAVIDDIPDNELKISVIIPCYNEPDILLTMESLNENLPTKFPLEIIVLINSSEKESNEIIEFNQKTYNNLLDWITKNSVKTKKYFVKNVENLPAKFAGVGLARKIAMDESLRRFNLINNKNGFIVSLDSDTICEKNYLQEIENLILKKTDIKAFAVNFEHQTNPQHFSEANIRAIYLYELYLRYYIGSLRFATFPYSFQTIGSAFGVRADVYAMQGGMNTKQAGEDFYFLHKIIPLGNFYELNSTKIYPSPRVSDRVPFGTGIAVTKILKDNTFIYQTYNFDAFKDLKILFEQKHLLSKFNNQKNIIIPDSLKMFLEQNLFNEALKSINSNCTNIENFEKRFFQWFDAFRILKFLNFSHENFYTKNDILIESQRLLTEINIKVEKTDLKNILNTFNQNY